MYCNKTNLFSDVILFFSVIFLYTITHAKLHSFFLNFNMIIFLWCEGKVNFTVTPIVMIQFWTCRGLNNNNNN